MVAFRHHDFRFEHTGRWKDASRLLLSGSHGVNVQVVRGRMSHPTLATEMSVHAARVQEDLRAVHGVLASSRPVADAPYPAWECIFDLRSPADENPWLQVHVALQVGTERFLFIWTGPLSGYPADESALQDLVRTFRFEVQPEAGRGGADGR